MAAFSSATLATVDLLGAGRSPLQPIPVGERTSALSVLPPGCPVTALTCGKSVRRESQCENSQLLAGARRVRPVHARAVELLMDVVEPGPCRSR